MLPALLALLPLINVAPVPPWLQDSEWFHAALLVPVALVSGPVLARAGRQDRRIGFPAAAAFFFLFAALFVRGEYVEETMTVLGATLLLLAHIRNIARRAR